MSERAPDSLRKHLRQLDQKLANRTDTIWDVAKHVHVRQTRPGESDSGPEHCLKVEHNIWRLISETGKLDKFTPMELFILSLCACFHDFDKGLLKYITDGKKPHGEGSGEYIYKNWDKFFLERAEAIAIDYIISIHDFQTEYKNRLKEIPNDHPTPRESINLQRLAVLLKAGDVLDTDATRVPRIAVDPDDVEGLKRDKLKVREAIPGFSIQGDRIVITAYPEDAEQFAALLRGEDFIQENEWGPIADELRFYRFPYELSFENSDRYLESQEAAVTGHNLPGMWHYLEEDAAIFKGRDEDINRLIGLVQNERFSLLIGRSGVGKSSLVHAGLKPRIKALREWDCIVTRPDVEEGLIFTAGDFGPGFTPTMGFSEICREKHRSNTKLLVVLDQFEDVAYYGFLDAKSIIDTITSTQRELANLNIIFSYRDDVESILGKLWQKLSRSSEGPSKHYLEPLSKEGAGEAFEKLLSVAGIKLEPPEFAGRLLEELITATDKEAGVTLDAVYPPFIQMVAHTLIEKADGGIVRQSDFEAGNGLSISVAGQAITDYLIKSIERIKDKGYSVDDAKSVLTSLARMSGKKGHADIQTIASEARFDEEKIHGLLEEMTRLRLVRRLASGNWEIAHDLLARRVIEEFVDDEQRRYKYAREALESRARVFKEHGGVLTPEEMRELWLNRELVPPGSLSNDELKLVLRSIMSVNRRERIQRRCEYFFEPLPSVYKETFTPDIYGTLGWYWLNHLPRNEFLNLFNDASLGQDGESLKTMIVCSGLIASIDAAYFYHRLTGDIDYSVCRAVVNAMAQFKEQEALPLLRKMAKDKDENVRRAVAQALAHFKEIEDLPLLREMAKDKRYRVRQAVAEALALYKETEALPLLWEMANDKDEDVRRVVVQAIAQSKEKEVLPLLRKMAKVKYEDVRRAVVQAIAQFKEKEALPLLREMVHDEEPYVRRAVVEGLAQFKEKEDLPLLMEMVKDKHYGVRLAVVQAITQSKVNEALPLLREMAKDKDEDVRRAVVQAIAQSKVNEALPLLMEMANDKDPYVRRAVVQSMVQFKEPEALPRLSKMANDEHSGVRMAVVNVMAQFKETKALLLLKEMAKDENQDIRMAVVQVIEKFKAKEALPLLWEMANDKDHFVRRAVVQSMAQFKETEALPLLGKMAKDEHSSIRLTVVQALAEYKETEALPLLSKMAKDEHPGVRMAVVKVMAQFKETKALLLLKEMAKDENRDVRMAVVQVIEKFKAKEALPLLREMARDKSPTVRQAVVEAIALFKETEALPLLREMARDKSPTVRQAVVEAIAQFKETEALPLLREMAGDENGFVCRSAATAISELVTDRELLNNLVYSLLDARPHISAEAASVIGREAPRDQILAFLEKHQREMTTRALAVLDWFLYAPPYLREAYEAQQAEDESKKD